MLGHWTVSAELSSAHLHLFCKFLLTSCFETTLYGRKLQGLLHVTLTRAGNPKNPWHEAFTKALFCADVNAQRGF